MSDFKSMSHKGVCNVCGKETDVVVCASAFGATSYAYCEHCCSNYLEPYDAMVSYIGCAGYFPDDINEQYQKLCRHILQGLGISEEKFIEDVKKENDDFYEFAKEQGFCDDFNFLAHEYMKFDCPNCGAPLEVWSDEVLESKPQEYEYFGYERRYLIRHCDKCGNDWENEWCTENGDVSESALRRKFWG